MDQSNFRPSSKPGSNAKLTEKKKPSNNTELKEYKDLLQQMSNNAQNNAMQRVASSDSIRNSLDQPIEFPADSPSATFQFLKTLHNYENAHKPDQDTSVNRSATFEEIERSFGGLSPLDQVATATELPSQNQSFQQQRAISEVPSTNARFRPPSSQRQTQTNVRASQQITITDQTTAEEFIVDKLSSQIEQHTSTLKKNLIDEFIASKKMMYDRLKWVTEQQKVQLSNELEDSKSHCTTLQTHNDQLERRVKALDIMMSRIAYSRAQKSQQVIDTRVLYRAFQTWRLGVKYQKRMKKLKRIADRSYKLQIQKRCFKAWWRDTVTEHRKNLDGNWQKKMERVSNNIISQYENELSKLRQQLSIATDEIQTFTNERAKMQSEMKKAFMRGVCALNLEAMTMFKQPTGTATLDRSNFEETNDPEEVQRPPPSFHRNDNSIPAISASLHMRSNVPQQQQPTTQRSMDGSSTLEAPQITVTRHKPTMVAKQQATATVKPQTNSMSTMKANRTVGRTKQ